MADVIDIRGKMGAKEGLVVAAEEARGASTWDIVRGTVAELEKMKIEPARVILIVDAKELTIVPVGAHARPSDLAGLCFSAAQLLVNTPQQPPVDVTPRDA